MDESKSKSAAQGPEANTPVEVVHDDIQPTKETQENNTSNAQVGSSATWQSLTDKTLDFLSHASNETLGACLVGLGASTYFVLGRVGLVVIGIAGGVVLHATWDGVRGGDGDEATKKAEQERRREAGVDVVKRVLNWKASNSTEDTTKPEDGRVYANQRLDFSGFEPETETAFNTFANAIIKDYVHYWYDPTIPGEQSFPASCRDVLVAFLLSLTGHLKRKRPADAFLDFVTNASSIIIVFLNELSAALNASPNAPVEDAIQTYLELKPDSSLSYMLDEKAQKAKLNDAAEDILQAYLDPKAYNCPPVHVFLKNVLAELVLGYTVTYCSAPHFLNEWIVYGLEESATTKEVMDMVDAGVEGRQKEDKPSTVTVDKLKGVQEEVEEVKSKKEAAASDESHERPREHRRQSSRAEEAMDEAMQEAKRLTQMMIEEDNRRAREEQAKESAADSSEDLSDVTNTSVPTPTSSQSSKERQSEDTAPVSTQASSPPGTPAPEEERPSTPTTKQQFTSFDQMVHNQVPTALSPDRGRQEMTPLQTQPQLTLHNASISIFDDSVPGERTSIKAKPMGDYMVQIEPSSSGFSGWMIARKYADFETLHEVLRRISVVTGVPQFTQAHADLPRWKTNTKASLRSELERYLTDAVRYQSLAESEGMKRFLEKDQGLAKSPGGSKAFGWPTPDAFGKFGGDMMNVLTKAPKQVGTGGKAIFGGVAGLVGGKKPGSQSQISLSRTSTSTAEGTPTHQSRLSMGDSLSQLSSARQSQESIRSVPKPSLERNGSVTTTASNDLKARPVSVAPSRLSNDLSRSTELASDSSSSQPPRTDSALSSAAPNAPEMAGNIDEASFNLPPPPSEISDDFKAPQSPKKSTDTFRSASLSQLAATSTIASDTAPALTPAKRPKPPLTERETSVAVELMFAVITELYTLSSAWQIRRTLLSAAKNFLLRPGNPQLLTIRDMLQTSFLDSNLSDSGIAGHIYKLRENALPTEEEMEVWRREYPEKSEEEKEAVKLKAKTLLVTRGMPQALTSVMGAAASGQALGRVFDCLQDERVARGLVFGLVLQGLKVVTH